MRCVCAENAFSSCSPHKFIPHMWFLIHANEYIYILCSTDISRHLKIVPNRLRQAWRGGASAHTHTHAETHGVSRRAKVDEGWHRFLRPFLFSSLLSFCVFHSASVFAIHWPLCVPACMYEFWELQIWAPNSTVSSGIALERPDRKRRRQLKQDSHMCVFVALCIHGTPGTKGPCMRLSDSQSLVSTRGGSLCAHTRRLLFTVRCDENDGHIHTYTHKKKREMVARVSLGEKMANYYFEPFPRRTKWNFLAVPAATSSNAD